MKYAIYSQIRIIRDMLIELENNDVYTIKTRWLRSCLNDNGIEI